MTPAHTVRCLLMAGPGEPLCDACLALACAVSLTEMRLITRNLLARPEFRRGTACASCRRDVPTIIYPTSCGSCGQPLAAGASCCAYATIPTEAKAGGL